MSETPLTIDAFLERKGIRDVSSYLAKFDETANVAALNHPIIELRGSVHLMLSREISRSEVDKRLDQLIHV